MKKSPLLHVFMLMGILSLFAVACNDDDEITLDFDITVPDNWNYYILANQGFVYTAERQATSTEDTIREYMTVYKEPLSGYSYSTYVSAIKNVILASDYYVSTIQEKDTSINGTESLRIIYREIGLYVNQEQDTFDVNLINTRYLFFRSNVGFNVSLVATEDSYSDMKSVFDDIMATFKFKE
jgi:hypothetical protein